MFIAGITYKSTIKEETSSAGRIRTNPHGATTISTGKGTVDTVVKYQTTEGTKATQSAYKGSTNAAVGTSATGARVSTSRRTIKTFAADQNTAETAPASAQTGDSGSKSSDSGIPAAQTTASRFIGSKSVTHIKAGRETTKQTDSRTSVNNIGSAVNKEARNWTFIGSTVRTPSNEPIGISATDLAVTRQTLSTERIKGGRRGSGRTVAENRVTSPVTLTSFDTGKTTISTPFIESTTRSAHDTTTAASNLLGKMNYFCLIKCIG